MPLSPHRRSDTSASPQAMAGLAVILVGLMWTVGVALLSVRMMSSGSSSDNAHVSSVNNNNNNIDTDDSVTVTAAAKLFPKQPPAALVLWPDDSQNLPTLSTYGMLTDCLHHEHCLQRVQVHSSTQRIGVLTPPSVLGRSVMASIVTEYVKMQKNSQLQVEVTSSLVSEKSINSDENTDNNGEKISNSTTVMDNSHYYTKIVRVAVLPMHLEAIDLILQTIAADTLTKITLDLVKSIIRLLAQWHCRISTQIATNTALLTMTMDPSLAFPMHAETQLADFLGYAPAADDDASVNHIHADPLALIALERIDDCRDVLKLLLEDNPDLDIAQVTNDIIKSVGMSEKCSGDSVADANINHHDILSGRNSTFVIQQILSNSTKVVVELCSAYNHSHLPICDFFTANVATVVLT